MFSATPIESWSQNLDIAVEIIPANLVSRRRYYDLHVDFIENCANSGFEAAIFESRMVIDIPGLCHIIARAYLGKVAEGFLFIPCSSEMAAER
jgi:hypothetical protein